MRLKSLRIKNYRAFDDAEIEFDAYTSMVGPNGSGKSTVLSALNVLFRERDHSPTDTTHLVAQDFHGGNTDLPIEIIATFIDLTDAAKEDLNHYVRHEQLIVAVVAIFDSSTGKAEVKQYGERLGIERFAPYFHAHGDGAKVSQLKEIYRQIHLEYPDLPPPSTQLAMRDALSAYEASHPELCASIRSQDIFYGARKGRLDPYVQWVYVPAVKDARTEQVEGKSSALGRLLARTVRAKVDLEKSIEDLYQKTAAEYSSLLEANKGVLTEVSGSLLRRLREWSHPNANLNLVWAQDAEKSVRIDPPLAKVVAGEGVFEGDIARLGHGLQRSYILAVLHELALLSDSLMPTLILGIEEPELYQHPPQARHLADVLYKISEGGSQVIITTHNPAFTPGQRFENVRMFRRIGDQVRQSMAKYEDVAQEISNATDAPVVAPSGVRAVIHQAMLWSLSDIFFYNKVVLVEGAEDVAYLTSYLEGTFRINALRAKGVGIVACSGKSSMIKAISVAKCLKIPFFAIWDSDGNSQNEAHRSKHRADNIAILKLVGATTLDPFPDEDCFDNFYVRWKEEIASSVKNDLGSRWANLSARASIECGQAPGIKKNSMYISELMSAIIEESASLPSIEAAVSKILNFSEME